MSTQNISSRREQIFHVADAALVYAAAQDVAYYRYKAGEPPDRDGMSDLLKLHEILHSGRCRLTAGEMQKIYEKLNSMIN
jgi:hypothetical protein